MSTSRWHLSAAGLNRHGRESACVSAVWRENVSNFPVSRHVVTHHEKRRYGLLSDCFYVLTRRVAFHLNSRRKIFYSFSISPRIEYLFYDPWNISSLPSFVSRPTTERRKFLQTFKDSCAKLRSKREKLSILIVCVCVCLRIKFFSSSRASRLWVELTMFIFTRH